MRTDVHAPKNLVTEDYELIGCGEFGSGSEPGHAPFIGHLVEDGWRFGENQSAGGCYHCGAHIRYYALLKHVPTRTIIRVGEQCLDNRFELATAEFQKLRKAAALNRDRMKKADKRTAWLDADPANAEAFAFAEERVAAGDHGYNGMLFDFVHKVNRYGDTSEKFVAAILRSKVRHLEWEARRAAEAAEHPAAPVVAGKAIVVTGEILSVKTKENDFGSRLVMTVRDDRGFKVWGSVPAALKTGTLLKGERVSFTADVEVSDTDETFGFISRPRKASFV